MKKNNSSDRRRFLKSSLLGLSGTLAAGKLFASYNPSEISPVEENKTIKRKLGNTGIELPVVSMGVMRADNPNIVKAALKSGIVHLDTAHVYQNGKNEIMLGELLKGYPRDSFVISTKIKPRNDGADTQNDQLTSSSVKEAFLNDLDISLQRLQMDYVDIVYVHGVGNREEALSEPVLEALKTAKAQGKVKHVGLSTHSHEPEVIQAAIDSDLYEVVLTAINFKQDHYLQIKEKIAAAAAKGIGIVAMKTMAGAFIDKERKLPINCKAALKWVLQDPNIHTAIPGITSFDMLEDNISVMENLEFTEQEMEDLDAARLQAGMYCNNCQTCLGQCKKHLPVNEIMRAYMYTYGYNHFEKAHTLLTDHNIAENPCGDCNDCTVNCIKGFDIAGRIADVTRLRSVPQDFIV